MKKNVAFVIGHLSHGGAEKQIYLLSKGLNKKRFSPVVICLSKTAHPWGDRILVENIPIVYIHRISRFDLTRLFRLIWLFYKFNIDIIVSSLHIANVYSWFARLFYFRKSRYLAQIRSKESLMRSITKWLNICALSSADVIITNSKLLNSFVAEFFKQNHKKIITINNGIEIQESKKTKNDSRVIHIGTVGKDTHAKNMDIFIELALKLIIEHENLHFHLCGRELERNSRLFELISEKNQPSFTFYGEVDDPTFIYQNLDIYVSTSRSEGSPNTILESLSFGLPVVATNVGGVSELVEHGENGFLVPSGDLDGLVQYCKILIDDSVLRTKIGQKGSNFISKNFSSVRMVREFEDVLLSL